MSASLARAFDVVRLARADDVEGWRTAARLRLTAGVPPEDIVWEAGDTPTADLFAAPSSGPMAGLPGGSRPRRVERAAVAAPRVPRAFLELAERVACHRDPDRFALLYRVLWRIAHGEPGLLADAGDADVHRLERLGKAVSRERHKMHAFVRFRRTPGVEPEHFGAWFEPEHHTLRLASGFFVRRFATMRWSIVTPDESAHWDTRTLVFGPGGRVAGTCGQGPDEEAMEVLWRTYFASIFNPARLKLDAMRAEMPVKYWKNLPEAPLIAGLVAGAGRRAASMIAAPATDPPRFAARATHPEALVRDVDTDGPPPRFADLAALRADTARCTRCEHACLATRAVDGEGGAGAPLMLVGEQPGDHEDIRGRPFVGPAGQLLRVVLEELGIEPGVESGQVFLTNAVRHFRHEPQGKRRLHRTPTIEHVERCRPYLFEEIRLVGPRVIVALGATAARALLGRPVRIGEERGRPIPFGRGTTLVVTAHPAAVLRAPDEAARTAWRAALRADLAVALAEVKAQT